MDYFFEYFKKTGKQSKEPLPSALGTRVSKEAREVSKKSPIQKVIKDI